MTIRRTARLAVDIGGTFTDLALETADDALITTKVLTTPAAPEQGVFAGVGKVLDEAGIGPDAVGLAIHGTTLATNALIERKGARTAMVVTGGFRDAVEMAYENRFEQYDINIDRPAPLVPRDRRWPVRERVLADGEVRADLIEDDVAALLPQIDQEQVESIAVCLIHAYANPAHEHRVANLLASARPALSITLSSAVCPEIREYERFSTACANAYVQPLMAGYLARLSTGLAELGLDAPLLMMTSGGGLTTLETAMRFPIRLVESGPAGGAILASRIAAQSGFDRVLAFDMGGTTAKLCLIDNYEPLTSRLFEVARAYRDIKGSGLPLRIPVIEMVEIGAGGGSIARIDSLGRLTVGPDSAGADPGPASYDRGGTEPTVTDADVVLGRIDPAGFAPGAVSMKPSLAGDAVAQVVGKPMQLDDDMAAYAISEVVDEAMASAARVHAIEWGKGTAGRAMIAFGGAAPVHACRLADKLGVDTILVPTGAGVGSAIGFLRAPIAYEVVRSRYVRLSGFDAEAANALLDDMRAEAMATVRLGAPDAPLSERRLAYMRYIGQGHEITVTLPDRPLQATDVATLQSAFDAAYDTLYGRTIPNLDVEILTWAVLVSTQPEAPAPVPDVEASPVSGGQTRSLFDGAAAERTTATVYQRASLEPGARLEGPAAIVEDQTTTILSTRFDARVDALCNLVLTRKPTP